MKQSYASAGKAPRRRVHSLSGIAAIAGCGLPPPRIIIGYPAHQAPSGAEPCLSFLVLESVAHGAGRNATPSVTSPVVTRRHSAMSNLRASATIIVVLRAPLGPSVRVRYQRASALSFWNTRKRHANWISPRRTRALPALARPFSRRFKPLRRQARALRCPQTCQTLWRLAQMWLESLDPETGERTLHAVGDARALVDE